jgi:hypothetical protein
MLTFPEAAPTHYNKPYLIGHVVMTADEQVSADLDILWQVRYGHRTRYPADRYEKFSVHFVEPLPRLPEQPPAPDEAN